MKRKNNFADLNEKRRPIDRSRVFISYPCENPACDHKSYRENRREIEKPTLTTITTLNDLIKLGNMYHCRKLTEYNNINLRLLFNIVPAMTELSKMIGMNDIKDKIIDQILFFLQGYNSTSQCNNCIECTSNKKCIASQNEMLHTVILGDPGVGKTELARILGKLYKGLGILTNDIFKIASRIDFIAKYEGQTVAKTENLIASCDGGVLFIDEAYSLGNDEHRGFGKEAIDTLNLKLSENKSRFLCIIAGYKNELDTCFFNVNPGLKRRFPFVYNIKGYNHSELLEILELKIKQSNWNVFYNINDSVDPNKTIIKNLFKENKEYFTNFGGDVETLLLNIKIVHSRNCLKNNIGYKKLSLDDIKSGLTSFIKTKESHDHKSDAPPASMYC